MIKTSDDQVDQIIKAYQAAFIVDCTEWQRHTTFQPANHGEKIGLYPWAVDQYRTNDDQLHFRRSNEFSKRLFCFMFGKTVGIGGRSRVVCSKRYPWRSVLTIDLYGAYIDKPPHTCLRSLLRQIHRAVDIDQTEFCEWVPRGLFHYMHPCSSVNDDIDAGQRLSPILLRCKTLDRESLY